LSPSDYTTSADSVKQIGNKPAAKRVWQADPTALEARRKRQPEKLQQADCQELEHECQKLSEQL